MGKNKRNQKGNKAGHSLYEEKKGDRIVKGLFIALIALGLIIMVGYAISYG